MSTDKGNKPVAPVSNPNIGKIQENSQKITRPTTNQPTQTPTKGK